MEENVSLVGGGKGDNEFGKVAIRFLHIFDIIFEWSFLFFFFHQLLIYSNIW